MSKKNLLYIADHGNVTIIDLSNLKIISSYELPTQRYYKYFRGLKLDNNILYLTMSGIHEIFLCSPQNGKVLKKWGNYVGGSKQEQFHSPFGITLDNKYAYICDCDNHRVQILKKDSGKFSSQWGKSTPSAVEGQFTHPCSIYFYSEIFYVGDYYFVQLFTKDNIVVHRIGTPSHGDQMNQFYAVYGICIIDDRLYVSDFFNNRIQIFRETVV